MHQELKVKLGIKDHHGLYHGPVKMTGTGVFLDKSEL
ncbi:hypothetical protein M2273_005936 [Mucilaginibacter lappiensis]